MGLKPIGSGACSILLPYWLYYFECSIFPPFRQASYHFCRTMSGALPVVAASADSRLDRKRRIYGA